MRSTPIGLVVINDGRQHVIEQNEDDNLEVARQWAAIIREDARNVDGTAPDVVVGSETIKSVRVGQRVGEELRRAGCRQIVMAYNVWDFPYLVWPFFNSLGRDLPVLSLSNNNGEYPGNVGLLATDGALRQAGFRTHRIVGEMGDARVRRRLASWIRASQAITTMKNEVYGLYGGHSMGMETGWFHLVPTIRTLGTTTYHVDQFLLVKTMETVDEAEVERGFGWFQDLIGDRILFDGDMLTPDTLKTQIRLYLAMRELNEENGFDFCGLKGQRELTEHVTLGDIPEMLMNDPYDWNGPKLPVVCATEADAYAGVSMQILKYISGGLPVLFMDVRLYHPELDLWDFVNSGNHASWYAALSDRPEDNLARIRLHPALKFYFKAGGASVEFDAAPTALTFCRLGLWNDRLYMVICQGESVELPPEDRKRLNAMTNPTWPHVHARLACSYDEFLSVFPCNHILAVQGDRVQSLIWACEIAGITPIVLGEAAGAYVRPLWERLGESSELMAR
ncbi:MAG TPA: fucose isomerase [Chloroflexi bacterium]|nr:fucose isomerase [Chloroflexota bacterium]